MIQSWEPWLDSLKSQEHVVWEEGRTKDKLLGNRIKGQSVLWNESCPPQKSYVEALIPSVIVFWDGDFGRYLGLDKVIRVGLSWWN